MSNQSICVASNGWCAMINRCAKHEKNNKDASAHNHFVVLASRPVIRHWNCDHFVEREDYEP